MATLQGFDGSSTHEQTILDDLQDSSKRKMRTTVAVRVEKDPHQFKIHPLKQVPPSERPSGSPVVDFGRPFAGPRSQMPMLYPHAPDRLASTYSFNNLGEESPSLVRPGSPPPRKARARKKSTVQPTPPVSDSQEEGIFNLARKARDSLAGPLETPRSVRSVEPDIEKALALYCDSPESLASQSWDEPDLTFGTSNELSGPPLFEAPFTSTPSSESVRKAKRIQILDSTIKSGVFRKTALNPPPLDRVAILQRRGAGARLKALSVSSLSASHTQEDGRIFDQKRHAIYADSAIQIQLPSDSRTSSVISVYDELSPSKQPSFVTPPRAATNKKIAWHLYTKSEVPSRCTSGAMNTLVEGRCLEMPPSPRSNDEQPTSPPLPPPIITALNFKNKPRRTRAIAKSSPLTLTIIYHPIVLELFQVIETDRKQWNAIFASR